MPVKLVDPATNVERDFYTPEELESTVTQRTGVEKRKLYDDLEAQKRKTQKAEDDLAAAKRDLESVNLKLQNSGAPSAAEKAEAERLRLEVASLTTKVTESDAKTSALIDAALDRANVTFQAQRQADQKAAELEKERTRIIAAAQGKIIPDLVTGNTVEELTASAAKATARYTEVYEAGKKEAEDKIKGALPGPVNPGSNAVTTPGGATVDLGNLRSLDSKEWEAQKKAIKQAAFTQVGFPMKVS